MQRRMEEENNFYSFQYTFGSGSVWISFLRFVEETGIQMNEQFCLVCVLRAHTVQAGMLLSFSC